MNEHSNPRREIAELYPWHLRNKLVAAGRAKDHKAIDALTDTLASIGLARPRSDASMFTSVRFSHTFPPTKEQPQ